MKLDPIILFHIEMPNIQVFHVETFNNLFHIEMKKIYFTLKHQDLFSYIYQNNALINVENHDVTLALYLYIILYSKFQMSKLECFAI